MIHPKLSPHACPKPITSTTPWSHVASLVINVLDVLPPRSGPPLDDGFVSSKSSSKPLFVSGGSRPLLGNSKHHDERQILRLSPSPSYNIKRAIIPTSMALRNVDINSIVDIIITIVSTTV